MEYRIEIIGSCVSSGGFMQRPYALALLILELTKYHSRPSHLSLLLARFARLEEGLPLLLLLEVFKGIIGSTVSAFDVVAIALGFVYH